MPHTSQRCFRHSIALVVTLGASILLSGCFFGRSRNSLEEAEELSRQDKIPEAILAYRRHISARLAVENRPEWENPNFYLILIGDLELRRGNVESALAAFQEAREKGVHESLISDRYRAVARWYEERGELELAFQHLKTYRDLDPLLFDAMLDRIAREIVEKEEAERTHQGGAPPPSEMSPSEIPLSEMPQSQPLPRTPAIDGSASEGPAISDRESVSGSSDVSGSSTASDTLPSVPPDLSDPPAPVHSSPVLDPVPETPLTVPGGPRPAQPLPILPTPDLAGQGSY